MSHITLIPKATLDELELTGLVEPIEKKFVDGNVSEYELAVIASLVAHSGPKNIFEIGTFDGRTTVNFAHFSSDETKVYTIDLPKDLMNETHFALYDGEYSDKTYIDKKESGARFKKYKGKKKITQLYGDSGTFDFKPYVGGMDFVFVDGSHAKDYVQNDTELALRLCKKGVILWHDYGVWEDVTNILNHYFKTDFRFANCRHIENTSLVYLKI